MTNEEKFKQELRELFKRYRVSAESYEDYNEDDEPSGSHYSFSADGFSFDAGDLAELCNE